MIKVYLGNITGAHVAAAPLSSGILRCYAEQNSVIKDEVEWPNFLYNTEDGVDHLVRTKIHDPDVLGLSCYSWNLNRNLKIARRVKDVYPNCLVVFGGPEIPEVPSQVYNFSEYFNRFTPVDLLVASEGELPFEHILLNVISGERNWESIPNVHYRRGDKFVFRSKKDELPHSKKFIETPSPWLRGYFDFIVDELSASGRRVCAVIESSRGCPNKCTFCMAGNVNGSIRVVNLKQTLEEIDYMSRMSNEVIMADANFGILKRDEVIADKLAKTSRKYGILKEVYVSWTKDYNKRVKNIAVTLSNANLINTGVTVSLQTTTPKVLSAVKRKNMDFDSYSLAIKDLRNIGSISHTELIVGLPKETKESFLTSVEKVLDVGPTKLPCFMMTLTSNSVVNNKDTRDKYKIETKVVNIYDKSEFEDEFEYIESIKSTDTISEDEMNWLFKWKDFFATSYMGLWLHFISEFLKREHSVRRVDFISTVLDWGFSNPSSVIGKCITNWYIKNYNSGSFVSFVGPTSPHSVDWGDNFFLKQTFHWLCISESRNEFYKELAEVIGGMDLCTWNKTIEEALRFQKEMMISPDYDPAVGVSFRYKFNWFEYFHFGDELKRHPNTIHYTTKYSGHHNTPIKPNDPASMFITGGGDLYKQQVQNTFIHRNTELYKPTTSNLIVPREEQTNK